MSSHTGIMMMRYWEIVRQDVAYALRGLVRAPLFAATIVVTLALGIGSNAALFSLVERLFLRAPAGIEHPDAIRRLYLRTNWSVGDVTVIRSAFYYPAYEALAASLAPRARLAAYTAPDSMRVGNGDGAPVARGVYATSSFLSLLGVHPAIGRFFNGTEDRMGAGALVAVISQNLWQRQFHGDPAVIGRQVDIARQRYTIIGIAQPDFRGADLDATDIWLPLATLPAPNAGPKPWYDNSRSTHSVRILARITPGTSNEWLSAVGTTAVRRGEQANVRRPDATATVLAGPVLESLGPSITPTTQVAIATRLIGVVLIVLLIACANVANLLIVRGLRRRREIAVRLALGVSRGRLVSQLLIESLTIALIAGAAAILIGTWAGAALRHLVMPQTHWAGSPLDWWLVAATGVIALVTGLLAGVAPALQSTRLELTRALKGGTHGRGRQRSRLRPSLIALQAALSVVLLAGAGLFIRSLHDVQGIDVGYDVDHLAFATIQFLDPDGHYVDRSGHGAELAAGMPAAAARIATLPGVEATALSTAPPMGGYAGMAWYFEDGTPVPRPDDLDPAVISATPSFFSVSGARLLRGRLFTAEDRAGAPAVVVVNETTAKRYWPGRNAIGQCLRPFTATAACMRVIGVTKDSHLLSMVEKPQVEMYVPMAQQQKGFMSIPRFLVVRADPSQMTRVEHEATRELRRTFPNADPPVVSAVSTLLEPELRPWRLGATLFSAFGLLALVVSAVGIYSVVSYSASERVHEMGVRIALGAQQVDVVRLVVGQGMRSVAAGIVLGILTALALGRFVASMLYETSPHDPLVLGIVALVLASIACVASGVPAIRVAATDPATALRSE